MVPRHTSYTTGIVCRCPNITKKNNEKMHNAIIDVIHETVIMGDFNRGNIKRDTLQSARVDGQTFIYLTQGNCLTQLVLDPTRGARY